MNDNYISQTASINVSTYSPDLDGYIDLHNSFISVWDELLNSTSPHANMCKDIIQQFNSAIKDFLDKGYKLEYLPLVSIIYEDDDSLTLNWKFSNFIIGISIEATLSQSGWYLVSNSHLGDMFSTGNFIDSIAEVKTQLKWLSYFITLYGIDNTN